MAGPKGKSKAQIKAEDRIAALVGSRTRGNATSRRRNDGVPDVYQEMLSEAADAGSNDLDKRPAKRQRLQSPDYLANGAESENDLSHLPKQTIVDSGESEDEDVDWEEVDFDQVEPADQSSRSNNKSEHVFQDITVAEQPQKTTSKKAALKRKPITSVEKLLRLAVHEAHVLFLIFHVHVRNSWCNMDSVQSKLKTFLPLPTVGLLHPREDRIQFSRSEDFINGLKMAVDSWRSRFRITGSGMKRSHWADSSDEIKQQINSISDGIPPVDKKEFIKRATTLAGSQDVGNQLFCALLRSVGLEARLVCSLQPLPFGTAGARPATPLKGKPAIYADNRSDGATSAEEGSVNGSASDTSNKPTGRRRRIGQPKMGYGGTSIPLPASPAKKKPKPSSVKRIDYPIFWVEVFNSAYQRWVPVDATVTGTVNKPAKLEPPASYDQNSMSYVVAFDDHGYARDVTRRYTKAYNAKTRKSRIESTQNGERWWKKALKPFRSRNQSDRDQIEDSDLAKKEAQEGLPSNVQDFKDHPYYALERHLKRHEVIHPKRAVGKVNAGKSSGSNVENVYRRSDVQLVRSAEKWYRVGRELKMGEQPLKEVPARRTAREQDDPNEAAQTTPLFAYFQTSLYVPPPVVDGRIPKNVYRNLDVYVPSMVPPGAVHIRHALGAKAAKVLGIDFADAVTGFKFKGRIGEAIKTGVVVASEYGDAMQSTIEGFQDAAQAEADAKKSAESLRLWRRFLVGLRIGVRLGMYDDAGGEGVAKKKAEAVRKQLDEEEDKQDRVVDAGGFFPATGEETIPTAGTFVPTAKPRSLLARAQEATENAQEDSDDEEYHDTEQIEETAPRLRRRRNATLKESEPEDDLDSEDDFVPETARPAPTRRTRGRVKSSSSDESIPTKAAKATPRRSTRQTKFKVKLTGESEDEQEDLGGGFIPEPFIEPVNNDNDIDMKDGGGGFLPEDANLDDHSGGGFIPEADAPDPNDQSVGFIPEQHLDADDHDYGDGGGFIPEEDDEGTAARPTAAHFAETSAADEDMSYAGGFIPEDVKDDNNDGFAHMAVEADNQSREPMASAPHKGQAAHAMANTKSYDDDDNIDEDNQGDKDEDNQGDSDDKEQDETNSESDDGSLLSHDPEDEDAEPEWLNSD